MINPKYIKLQQELDKLTEEWKRNSPLRLVFKKYIEGNDDFVQVTGTEAFILRAALQGKEAEIQPNMIFRAMGGKEPWREDWSVWLNKKADRVVMLEKWTALTAAREGCRELRDIKRVEMEGMHVSHVQLAEFLDVAGVCSKWAY